MVRVIAERGWREVRGGGGRGGDPLLTDEHHSTFQPLPLVPLWSFLTTVTSRWEKRRPTATWTSSTTSASWPKPTPSPTSRWWALQPIGPSAAPTARGSKTHTKSNLSANVSAQCQQAPRLTTRPHLRPSVHALAVASHAYAPVFTCT